MFARRRWMAAAPLVAAFALAAPRGGGGPAAAPARAPASATAAEVAAALAEVTRVERSLAALEGRLGFAPGPHSGQRDEFRARYAALREREAATAARAGEWLRYVPSTAPVDGGVLTSTFSASRFHPVKLRVLAHRGVDIAARAGTPVRATADGSVYATVDHPTAGLTVDVLHGASGFMTRYSHLERIGVRPGTPVRRGAVIGWVGRSGLATGDHCHYEVFYRGWRRDPAEFLPPGPVAAEAMLGAD